MWGGLHFSVFFDVLLLNIFDRDDFQVLDDSTDTDWVHNLSQEELKPLDIASDVDVEVLRQLVLRKVQKHHVLSNIMIGSDLLDQIHQLRPHLIILVGLLTVCDVQ
jgi:hypothetical protein